MSPSFRLQKLRDGSILESTWLFFLVLIGGIAAAEALVMFLIHAVLPAFFPIIRQNAVVEALTDAAFLSLLIALPIWFFVVRPLRGKAAIERFRAEKIVTQATIGIASFSPKGKIETANSALAGIFGYEPADLLGKDIRTLLPSFPLDAEAVQREANRYTAVHRDHSVFPMEVSFLRTEFAGNVQNLLFATDITLRVDTERKLAVNYLVMKILAEVESENIALSRISETICNVMEWDVGEIWRVDPADSQYIRIFTQWHRPDLEGNKDLADFETLSRGMRFRPNEGVPGIVWVSSQPMWLTDVSTDPRYVRRESARSAGLHSAFGIPIKNGGPVGAMLFYSRLMRRPGEDFIWMMAEIGRQTGAYLERQELERTLAERQGQIVATSKLAALGEMAGGIAHEINNPLATIHTLAGELQDLLEDESQSLNELRRVAHTIESTTMRIAKIVRGLRVFAREGSRDPFELVSVRDLVENTVGLCQERFLSHGVQLKIDPIPESTMIEARAVELSQVLLNLLNNGFDAAEKLPEKWVRVSFAQTENDIELGVADSGGGIPPTVQEKLFQPFYTTKEIGKGTGLGLCISRGIIENHKGTLRLCRESPHTRFLLRIPKRHEQHPAS